MGFMFIVGQDGGARGVKSILKICVGPEPFRELVESWLCRKIDD